MERKREREGGRGDSKEMERYKKKTCEEKPSKCPTLVSCAALQINGMLLCLVSSSRKTADDHCASHLPSERPTAVRLTCL